MIQRIWVKNFRMLAANRLDLGRFAVLVGRNASGKSTLMSALRFVSAVLTDGVQAAIDLALDGSGASFRDLCFFEGQPIAIALAVKLGERSYRYELEVGPDTTGVPLVLRENLYLLPDRGSSTFSSVPVWHENVSWHSRSIPSSKPRSCRCGAGCSSCLPASVASPRWPFRGAQRIRRPAGRTPSRRTASRPDRHCLESSQASFRSRA